MHRAWFLGMAVCVLGVGTLIRVWTLPSRPPYSPASNMVMVKAQAAADSARAAVLEHPEDWEANRKLLLALLLLRDRQHVHARDQENPDPVLYGANTLEIEALLVRLERLATTPERLRQLQPLQGWAGRAGGHGSLEADAEK